MVSFVRVFALIVVLAVALADSSMWERASVGDNLDSFHRSLSGKDSNDDDGNHLLAHASVAVEDSAAADGEAEASAGASVASTDDDCDPICGTLESAMLPNQRGDGDGDVGVIVAASVGGGVAVGAVAFAFWRRSRSSQMGHDQENDLRAALAEEDSASM